MSFDVTVPRELFVVAVDLYILLGNTLDKTIEACSTLPVSERRISVKLKTHNNILFYKLAGVELGENRSGKHKGCTSISKRRRKRLRRILFQVVLPIIRSNVEFRSVYEYYTTRIQNPLKSKQAMIAVACKLMRVF